MEGSPTFYDICTAADPVAMIGGLSDKQLHVHAVAMDELTDVASPASICGFVRSIITVEAANRFLGLKDDDMTVEEVHEAVYGGDFAEGATTAEGLESGLRGEKL